MKTRNDGLMHGMMMFGPSVVGGFVLFVIGSTVTTANLYPLLDMRLVTGTGSTSFIALLLGWLAATGGASTLGSPTITEAKQADATGGLT